jgi:VIT1/CCC1 family predicted Fe2+/Mn2+ transporter
MREAIEAHLGSAQVARVIYGAIIGLAFVVSLQAHPPKAAVMAGSILATALAVALAEIYSDIIGTETRTRARVPTAHKRAIAKDSLAVAGGIGFPAVFFVLASAGVLETDTAFTLAKWSGLALIALYGYVGGRLSGRGVPASILHGLAVGLIGGFLIAFKSLLH